MSNFAEIDENNIVLRVLVGDNDFPNEGYDWFVENLGGTWIQTSYNGNIRKNFDTCNWTAPTPYPTDDKLYTWDEDSQTWSEINE